MGWDERKRKGKCEGKVVEERHKENWIYEKRSKIRRVYTVLHALGI